MQESNLLPKPEERELSEKELLAIAEEEAAVKARFDVNEFYKGKSLKQIDRYPDEPHEWFAWRRNNNDMLCKVLKKGKVVNIKK